MVDRRKTRPRKTFKFKCFGRKSARWKALDIPVDAELTIAQRIFPSPSKKQTVFADRFELDVKCPHICGGRRGRCNAARFPKRKVACPYAIDIPWANHWAKNHRRDE